MIVNQAVIVCGGYGKRLGKISLNTPKPLIKYRNFTVLEYLIKNLSRFGIKKIFLLTHYKHTLFENKFHKKMFFGINVYCVKEKKLLGSSGALYKIRKKLDKNFLFCNADTFFDINISDLIFEYFKKKKIAFMALKKIKSNKRYDTFNLSSKNLVKEDLSKKSYLINSGICIFSKKIITYLVKKGSLEKYVYKKLIKINSICGKVYNNDFIDIGLPSTLKKLPRFIEKTYRKPALFLDRDGVINQDKGYVYKEKDFVWRKNIINFIKKYNRKNFYVFVITNQSGIGRGYYTEKDMIELHDWMLNKIRLKGANIDKIYFSPYFKNSNNNKYRLNKKLRKPNIGMILQAKKDYKINLKKSILIGDSLTDMQTAINAGIKYKILPFHCKLI